MNGSGQIVGLVEFDTFNPSDVADYLNTIGKPASLLANVTEVPVNGGVATPGANQSEVLLDIDEILTLAPGAKIVVYDAPFTGPGAAFQPIINQMIDDGVTIIANTWNYCEDQTSSADVFSIDSLFQTAAASGITVFNATGDAGSTCKDGSANTVAVPADSPNAVAVGGTTLTSGPGFTYGSETWWNGTTDSPPSGQGGFGVSKFFARPPYQDAFVLGASRWVPDVADSANPNNGFAICQANAGGCPAFLKGGTSAATMAWAAFQALVNQSVGHDLGFVNPAYYSFADTDGFHNAASMGSDFPHVGLGSPNLPHLHLQLCGQKPGPADSTDSQVLALAPGGTVLKASTGVAADGTKAGMQAILVDANGNSVSGKTVALSANAGSHVTITPPSAVSNIANGVANFSVSDKTVETVTFTATDKTDGVVLKQTPQLAFIGPPATGAGLDAFPASVTADGKSNAVIAVTLKDALGRPGPGKLVSISQGSGHSVITGPTPSVTDATGQVQFNAVDQMAETITYSAVDVTDGNLPFPTTGTVAFTGGPANGCGNSAPPAAPGFLVTPYATGFIAQNYFYGDINFAGCPGAYGMAFDAAGNLYVTDSPTGNIYKFKPGGGVADTTTLLTTTAIGPSLAGLAFDRSGRLFASRDATTGNFLTGAVFQIDPANGTILHTVASDSYLSNRTFGRSSQWRSVHRRFMLRRGIGQPRDVAHLRSGHRHSQDHGVRDYAWNPECQYFIAPSGTIYAWAISGAAARIAQVSGTDGPMTPTVSILPNLQVAALGAAGQRHPGQRRRRVLFLNPFDATTNASLGIGTTDLTTNPPNAGVILATGGGVNNLVRGPDGCVYGAQGDGVFKITDNTGACKYATATQPRRSS